MVASQPRLWGSLKTSRRANHEGESGPIAVQIAGTDPAMMAEAARIQRRPRRADHRHQHGLPGQEGLQQVGGLGADAGRAAGRARSSRRVRCAPSSVPVTLKMRTGWDREHIAMRCARARSPRSAGIADAHRARPHARAAATRATPSTTPSPRSRPRCAIPVVANGDITTPEKARDVLAHTGADAVMIGRAAQGRPWIFREIAHFLATGDASAAAAGRRSAARCCSSTCRTTTRFYGEFTGVRSARKHIGWYVQGAAGRRGVPRSA